MDAQGYEQRGYLNEDFRVFHLKDAMHETVDWHYHTFHKIIAFLSGKARYGIEGKSYPLEEGDLVLVGKGCIHRPEVEPDAPYDRIVIYISPDFLHRCSTPECNLETCFLSARESFDFVVRPTFRREMTKLLLRLEAAERERGFGDSILLRSLFFELLIFATRAAERQDHRVQAQIGDEKIVAILQYLQTHLADNTSIDELAGRFFISKYHMMRRFKEETGYTIHNYLNTKRLMLARELIANGCSAQTACEECGFGDYSAFSRAYRKLFSQSPRMAK